jgi:hypothetical protein
VLWFKPPLVEHATKSACPTQCPCHVRNVRCAAVRCVSVPAVEPSVCVCLAIHAHPPSSVLSPTARGVLKAQGVCGLGRARALVCVCCVWEEWGVGGVCVCCVCPRATIVRLSPRLVAFLLPCCSKAFEARSLSWILRSGVPSCLALSGLQQSR